MAIDTNKFLWTLVTIQVYVLFGMSQSTKFPTVIKKAVLSGAN